MHNNKGFTLLELLVAVAILAIISGVVVVSFQSVQTDSEAKASHAEMVYLKRALITYKSDVGYFPDNVNRKNPADIEFLYEKPVGVNDWNYEYRKGWNGPYISQGDSGYVQLGSDLNFSGLGNPLAGALSGKAKSIASPYIANVIDLDIYQWFFYDDKKIKSPYGRPYFVFDLDDRNKARVVSHGANKRYDSNGDFGFDANNKCVSYPQGRESNDDQVICLYQ